MNIEHLMHDFALNTDSGKSSQQEINNPCYHIFYNLPKNRICLTIKGFWKSCEVVPDYLNDWEKILKLAKPGFTLLIDLRTMITHPQELISKHVEALRLAKEAGMLEVANVAPLDKIAALQISAVSGQNGLPFHVYTSPEEAEAFLDSAAQAQPEKSRV